MSAVAMVGAAGCTSSGSSGDGGGDAAGSCAVRWTYEGHNYRSISNVDFQVGEKLGTVGKPSCDDTPSDGEDEPAPADKSTAYAVEGLDTDVAIAVGDTPEKASLFALDADGGLPPEVKELLDGS
ncbi:hypothetical protein GCM10010365_42050 [Streptomyces poonensis]|uniref:Uncharacterized protein n=1 Tax=Streptomyces poonensis TaxID=68255 RepID=A0A918PNX6_9ACTN|nr:hypothetical protein GCM10010365_42050 [Streptomyces poonensis]GLJ90987.1 hypothetical protein GCM10017589_35930 [Streptomyces poonensis]